MCRYADMLMHYQNIACIFLVTIKVIIGLFHSKKNSEKILMNIIPSSLKCTCTCIYFTGHKNYFNLSSR